MEVFEGKHWDEITRDERHFCAILVRHLEVDPLRFVRALAEDSDHRLELNPDQPWQVGFEVCFYRDLRKMFGDKVTRRVAEPEELERKSILKRTFDICLIGIEDFVVLEAKAQQGFKGKQLGDLQKDRELLPQLTGLLMEHVHIVALTSSLYAPKISTLDCFDSHWTWLQMAELYEEPRLFRANSIYGD